MTVEGDEGLDSLLSTMSEMSRNIAQTTSLDHTLRGVTSACVELIPDVAGASILIVEGPEEYGSLAPTSDLTERLDALQHRFRQGPCWDAATANPATRAPDLRADDRWPDFAPAAVEAGILSMLSFRLFTFDSRVGALNLFSEKVDAFSDESETVGGMLATQAATALIANDRALQFRSALASRDLIGQAKGMLMERFGVDAVRAFELLARVSSDRNVPLATIAERVVEKGSATVAPG
ncbi:GAF and ANTAR domain-containing protein [Tsukamurella ocularis]|uniref:GAF and ANTAR domain-containing protein n=1 Tax=Tsukamurella ocularis TaxID=1970234 RepID=UPI0039EEA03F